MFEARKIKPDGELCQWKADLFAQLEMYPDSERLLITPFSVLVAARDHRFLGAGKALGILGETDQMVIEVEDYKSPTGNVHFLGEECRWEPLMPSRVEEIAQYISVRGLYSAYEYALELDRR